MKNIAAKAAPTALVFFALIVFTWASLRANAAWHFFAAQSIAETLYESKQIDPEKLERASSHLNKALKHFPGNPDYLDFSGHLDVIRTDLPGVVGSERRKLLESAATSYRSALAVRPLWPYSWANLLAVKDKLGQVDSEFSLAINRSVETGPWEPRVQLQVIRTGLRYWALLKVAERSLVQEKVQDALKIQPRKVFVMVKNYGRPDLLCGFETEQLQIKRWCQKVL